MNHDDGAADSDPNEILTDPHLMLLSLWVRNCFSRSASRLICRQVLISCLDGARFQKQLLAANELEARNIKQLEKQLGLARRKSKKLPKSFQEDGLDYVITACDSGKDPVG
jgi:hypothetical protein